MFTSETTTIPLCEITIHDVSTMSNLSVERTLTVDNVELTEETLALLFKMMDRGKDDNN